MVARSAAPDGKPYAPMFAFREIACFSRTSLTTSEDETRRYEYTAAAPRSSK